MQRIGILRGGVSPEYEFSLQTGAEVARAVQDAGLEAVDMLLDREGMLHIKGIPARLEDINQHADFVWNALHGIGAEDGQIADMLDTQGVKYSGSASAVSKLAWRKDHAKIVAKNLGIKTPASMLFMPEGNESIAEITRRIYQKLSPPWVIKPLSGGGSARTHVAQTMLDLAHIVEESISHQEPFLVEQYIYGREAAVGVIDDFRNQDPYVLPVIEIRRGKQEILNEEKRKNIDDFTRVGGGFRSDEREMLENLAKKLHSAFGAKDYSQSEFVIDPYDRVWFIETDTHPHLRPGSPFLKALEAVGATLKDFVKNVLDNTDQ